MKRWLAGLAFACGLLMGCGESPTAPDLPGCVYTDSVQTPAGLFILRGIYLDEARCAELYAEFPHNTRPR